MKKFISALLAVLLMLSTLYVTAFAVTGTVLISGTAGEGVVGVLTVSGSGPIKDDVAYDYDDDGEVVSSQTMNSIAMTLSAYYDEQTAEMGAAAAGRFRVGLIREIVVEEVVIRSSALEYAQFTVALYRADAEPYADRYAAIEGFIAKCVREEQFQNDILPIYALQELFSIENGLLEESEEDFASMFEYYNEAFGSQAETAEELESVALELLNRHFGTGFNDKNEIFRIEQNEWDWDPDVVWAEELEDAYMAEADSVFDDGRMFAATLGEEFSDGEKAYSWLKVLAPGDSPIKESCEKTGVSFSDLYDGLCKYCHKDHSGSIWQRFIGFIHKILYFFSSLFSGK